DFEKRKNRDPRLPISRGSIETWRAADLSLLAKIDAFPSIETASRRLPAYVYTVRGRE
ncbi:MAG: hypothetical protein JWM11_2565, partial [Planctomycetaceae bacterium]|nr:hypothetical protein [Planctomycetaceae bacterium]